MTHPVSHDPYLATLPGDQATVLGSLRTYLAGILPEAEEVMSYAMPGFRIGTKVVAGYAAFARHCGLYPHSGNIIPQFQDELRQLGFKTSKSSVLFTPSKPLPDEIVLRIVSARKREIGLV
jgi:uncharacterized protein YdhG (YjbR/CyaY superfamily)